MENQSVLPTGYYARAIALGRMALAVRPKTIRYYSYHVIPDKALIRECIANGKGYKVVASETGQKLVWVLLVTSGKLHVIPYCGFTPNQSTFGNGYFSH
jgi:hypothetical protein